MCPRSLLCLLFAWSLSTNLIGAESTVPVVTPSGSSGNSGNSGNPGGLRLADDTVTVQWVRERIQAPLRKYCAECHADGKKKGGYRIDTYEQILSGGHDYTPAIRPWNGERSQLLKMIRWEGDEDLFMPPEEKLPAEVIADMERWVVMGAPWPDAEMPVTEMVLVIRPPWFGRLHPLLIHLPLGAVIVALWLELIALARHPCRLNPATAWVLALALVGVAGAIASGLYLAGNQNPDLLENHERLGWITGSAMAGAFILSFFGKRSSRWRWAARLMILAAAILAGWTGHFGGSMTWGEDWLW